MILEPRQMPIPTPRIVSQDEFIQLLDTVGPNVIDFETTGLDVLDPEFRAVGVALANGKCKSGVYLEIPEDATKVVDALQRVSLVGFNIGFDAKVLHRMALDTGLQPVWSWVGDVLVLYKLTDNSGRKGQSWSLKTAMKEVLGWEETNEVELDQWLVDNGHFTNRAGKQIPQKGEMWRAPTEVLGMYAGRDAAATWMLERILVDTLTPFPEALALYEKEFMTLARLVNEQFWSGLYVAKDKLELYLEDLNSRITDTEQEFLKNSPATPFIQEFNDVQHQLIVDAEPPQFTKTGKVTARYIKWKDKVTVSKETNYFNPSSKQQLRWLFYERLYRLSTPTKKINWKGEVVTKFNTVTKKGWEIWECSVVGLDQEPVCKIEGKAYPGDSVAFSIDKGVLPKLGTAGQLLAEYNKLVKERGYVEAMLNSLRDDSRHPTSLRVHGTVTGRCSGAGYEKTYVYYDIPQEILDAKKKEHTK